MRRGRPLAARTCRKSAPRCLPAPCLSTVDRQPTLPAVAEEVDLEFIARQLERLIGDNASMRDDMRVLTAIIMRLDNTRERLLTLYGTNASLDVMPISGGGTVARLRIPYRESVLEARHERES